MVAYYNEIDPFAAQWLRNLIDADLIAPGDVDERSIVDVRPSDLTGYTQCHFFAGIGVWSYALRRAGWPDDSPVWTGSCPCGPFSQAGQRKGFDDERHLWPSWHWLINLHRPATIFGEQVASTDGLGWLDLVQADMEGTGYAFAAPDICSAGVGAPNIRQRLFFLGHTIGNRLQGRLCRGTDQERQILDRPVGCDCATCELANAEGIRRRDRLYDCQSGKIRRDQLTDCSAIGGLGNPACGGCRTRLSRESEFRQGRGSGSAIPLAHPDHHGCQSQTVNQRETGQCHPQSCGSTGKLEHIVRPGPVNGFWRDADWLFCRDERWRPVEPGTFPLAPGLAKGMEHGRPEPERLAIRAARTYRRGTLKGYGNALNGELATAFIEEAMGSIACITGEANHEY